MIRLLVARTVAATVILAGLPAAKCADETLYLTWLDDGKLAAYVRHVETGRVALGFAESKDISGLGESAPVVVPQYGTPPMKLEQIGTVFRDYIRPASKGTATFEVWQIVHGSSAQPLRMAAVGNLLLVEHSSSSEHSGKAENALLGLLFAAAKAEQRIIPNLSISSTCTEPAPLADVLKEPFELVKRNLLLRAITPPFDGQSSGSSEFIIRNRGLMPKKLQLTVKPLPNPGNVRVTYKGTGNGIEKSTAESSPTVPACEELTISVSPSSFWKVIPRRNLFTFLPDANALSVDVPQMEVRGEIVLAGVIFLGLLLGVVAWRWIGTRDRRHRNSPVDRGDERQTPWWHFWKWSSSTGAAIPTHRGTEATDQALAEAQELVANLKQVAQNLKQVREFNSIAADLEQAKLELEKWKQIGPSPSKVLEAWNPVLEGIRNLVESPDSGRQIDRPTASNLADDLRGVQKRLGLTKEKLDEQERRQRELESSLIQYGAILRSIDPRNSEQPSVDEVIRQGREVAPVVRRLRAFLDTTIARYAKGLNTSVEPNRTAALAVEQAERLQRCSEALDFWKEIPEIRRLRDLIGSLSTVSDATLELKDYDHLLADTGMAPSELAAHIKTVAHVLRNMLNKALGQRITAQPDEAVDTEAVSLSLLKEAVTGPHAIALGNMLRLHQSMEAYFKQSPDSDAASLYAKGARFRAACEVVVSDFSIVGLRFHPVRFLAAAQGHDWIAQKTTQSLPYIHRNKRLLEAIRKRLESAPQPWDTVADVDQWGFDCKLDPTLSRQTQVWLWLAGALQTAGVS